MDIKNIISMGVGAVRARLLGRYRPLNMMISVTDRCDSGKCIYCRIPERKGRELSFDEWISVVDQAHLMGVRRLGIWGGEPLVREDVFEIAGYAKKKGMWVTMDTNGILVPDNLGRLGSVDHLIIAFDGDEEAHELNRGRGTYRLVQEAFRALKGRIPVWTITVLTEHNIGSIDHVIENALKYDCLSTFQVLHHNDILGRSGDPFYPSDQRYRDAVKKIIGIKKAGGPVASSSRYLEYLLAWPDYRSPTSETPFKGLRCWAGKLFFNVDTDGSVYPCSLLVGKMPSKRVCEGGLEEALSAAGIFSCRACDAACFTEYNYLYSLDIKTVLEWLSALRVSL